MQQKLFTQIHARVREAARRSGRSPDSVRIVAVSKGQEVEKISQLAAAGARDFGENYVQEWRSKAQQIALTEPGLASEIRWHFIGHLQSNKAKEIVGRVELLHSLDSLNLAKQVSEISGAQKICQRVCLEVNLAGEEGKSGLRPETLLRDLPRFTELPHLALEGLMAVPPALPDPEQVRPYFAQLKSLLDECNRSGVLQRPLQELSMGMSHDFEVAIEEGATLVRIGTALFGPRK